MNKNGIVGRQTASGAARDNNASLHFPGMTATSAFPLMYTYKFVLFVKKCVLVYWQTFSLDF